MPFVLVHGGGHGAWCWEPMLPLLARPVVAVDLPPVSIRGGAGRHETPPDLDAVSLADWAGAVLAEADEAGFDRFVLVGHSLAGLTIGEVALRAPERVAHLVFVSALAPAQGENGLSAMAPEMMERVAGGLTEAVVMEMFCNDMDATQTRFVLDHFGGDAVQVMLESVDRSGIPAAMAKTYVRLRRDNALTPAAQDASIAALEAVPGGRVAVVDLDTGHNVMISHPADLAAVLNALE
ncbi:MAG: hypothetical protein QOI08_1399 [Actinomycetota bacterium]|nr:hypothetical protein [Actinomycetota bacterium]